MENIIPFERIAEMKPAGVFILLGILIVSLYVLTKGADWLVEGAAQLSFRLGVPKIIVGATVVSLGTTSPEAAVSVLSAIQGNSGLALGNAIGSMICNAGLIFGLGCLISRIPVDRFILRRHGWLQFGSGVLLVVMVLASKLLFDIPVINRPMGLIMVALLVAYMWLSIYWARQHPNLAAETTTATRAVPFCLLLVGVGLVLVVVGAKCLVGSAEQICLIIGVPEAVLAATLVAFGTSLPELVTALTSIKKGHPEILVGNILGANILNILFVVGVSAAAAPIDFPLHITREVLYIQIPTMVTILLLFQICSLASRKTFSKLCGLPLLLIYAAFLVISYIFAQ